MITVDWEQSHGQIRTLTATPNNIQPLPPGTLVIRFTEATHQERQDFNITETERVWALSEIYTAVYYGSFTSNEFKDSFHFEAIGYLDTTLGSITWVHQSSITLLNYQAYADTCKSIGMSPKPFLEYVRQCYFSEVPFVLPPIHENYITAVPPRPQAY